ncbi:hypothetical protein GCM10017673_54490 [Streptosporangium violaceochromogenes]|nr:hypothetical protein GCM10017673_54490 [Streptosporangium violaceochromogenes]
MSVFDEALAKAVEATLEEAREQGSEPSVEDLRVRAQSERASLTSQGGFADDYRRAVARVPANGQDAPWLRVVRVADLLACLLGMPAACLFYGWTTAPQASPPQNVSVLAGAAAALTVLLAAGGAVFGIAWLLSPRDPVDRHRSLTTAPFLAAAALIGAVTTGGLTYLIYERAGGVWAAFVLSLVGGAWILGFTASVRTWWLAAVHPRAAARDREHLAALHRLWLETLVEAIRQVLRPEIQAAAERPLSTRLSVRGTLSLKRVRGEGHVSTPAEERLAVVSRGMDDGSIALSGPRGVGKTELLKTFCEDPSRLSVVVNAPVLYDRRDFTLHLFAEVCKRVLKDGPKPLRRQAGQHLRHISYLQTHAAEVGLNVPVVGLSFKHGLNRAHQPLTYPEIVYRLKEFLTLVGLELPGDQRLVIGIDELDRIQPATVAQDFLNEIKVIFDVPGCLFVLSVSDEALRAADLAPVGGRDVFDSAIDEVVRVEPLDQDDAERLLASRVIGLPVAFTGIFNALAGGIPRDLLRIARAAILFTASSEEEELPDTARRLVARELARITGSVDSRIPPEVLGLIEDEVTIEYGKLRELGERVAEIDMTIANRLFFLDTVLGVFSAGLTSERIRSAESDFLFTSLARAGVRIGNADHQARAALRRIRSAQGLEPI